jgi:hypothetical protein
MKVRTKMSLLSLGGLVATAVTLVGQLEFRKGTLDESRKAELDAPARAQCAAIAHDVHTMFEIQHASKDLSRLAEQMSQLVGQFTV